MLWYSWRAKAQVPRFSINSTRIPWIFIMHAPGCRLPVEVFTRFSPDFLVPTLESGRFSIRRMSLPARPELLLAMVHLPSKSYWTNDSQTLECAELSRMVQTEEQKVGHRRTLLLGDLNVDPFEPGMVGASGLHAMMTRQLAARQSRTVQGREYPMFYNPMWGHFGDRTGGPREATTTREQSMLYTFGTSSIRC